MFSALQASPEVSIDALTGVAGAFSPRFQVIGPFVLADIGGLSTLFGSPHDLGQALRAARPDCRAIAVASTASAALLLAAAHDGLTIALPGEERARLAEISLDVLAAVAEARVPSVEMPVMPVTTASPSAGDALAGTLGWRHPRDTHQAQRTRRPRARVPVAGTSARRQALAAIQQTLATLHRWGIHTLGALAALPGAEVHERLGEIGVDWQRLARGEDDGPLVPWLAEPVFESTLELEWPIEGFEPLSFVLARLFEPLAGQLERADRGATAIRTALHLTTRAVHVRVVPLPAPMRDPKTLRTLVLLDLESNPPNAAIDRVQVRLEPTPGRVLQWTLFETAQPAPEQVATLIARLTALAGEGRVGSPAIVDSWKPGAFGLVPFQPPAAADLDAPPPAPQVAAPALASGDCALALRRFRLPIAVRVRVDEGRPVHVITDRHGITGGAIVQASGPWRTSGEWWVVNQSATHASGMDADRDGHPSSDAAAPTPSAEVPGAWDRDEWDVAMADGTVYRLSVERSIGRWMLDGIFD